MSCESRKYPNVTQAVRECFEHNALDRGIKWDGDLRSGTFTYKQGLVVVKTRYTYDPDTKVFELQVIDKPNVATCALLYKRFLKGLKDCGYVP
jgi:hypothetical protein